MADSARSSDKSSRSPLKAKVVRSQKISEVKPEIPEESDESSNDRVPPPSLPRSHTPGQLASKYSSSKNRQKSELSIRQRSFSASQAPPRPATSGGHRPTSSSSKNTIPPPSGLSNGSHNDSSRDGEDIIARRPSAMRSTSAIVSSGATHATPPVISRRTTSATARTHGTHTPFPPLQNPKDAPDVPAAPASGMYWSKALASGTPHPSLRAHTMTLIGSNIYIFGGCDSRACFNDLYVLDADSYHWSKPHVVGDIPSPLRAMTCTAVGKKLIVFGGGDGPAYYNDVYVLDTLNYRWSRPRIIGERMPSKRRAHTSCLYKNGIYVFGGGDGIRALNDIWRLDVSDMTKMSWRLVSGGGEKSSSGDPKPKARGYHTANMVGGKLIIFGGSDGGECFDDVWVYDIEGQAWRSVSIPQTFRRLSHTATIVGSYLFVVGGHDGAEYSNDVLLLNLVNMTWDKRKVYGLPPSGRGYHGAVLHDSRLVIIGGFDGSEVFGDVLLLELAVHAYYSQISHFTIEV
ncbi:galactose oxidase [Sarocladium strictum]